MPSDPPRDLVAYEQAYSQSGFEAVQARYRKRLLIELLERLQPRSVLEVGCGLQSLARDWRRAERFVVVEPGPGFAHQARCDTAGRPDVEVIEATVEAAAGRLQSPFDLILVSSLLHEVTDCAAILHAVGRLADPDTVVHVNVPNARSFHRLLAQEMGLIEDVAQLSDLQLMLQQSRTFTLDTLQALVSECGFTVFESGSYFVKPFTHAQMRRMQEDGLLTDLMLDGLWNMTRHMPGLGSEIFVNMRRPA